LNTEKHKKIRKFEEKARESAHPMICLLLPTDDVISEKQTTKQPVER